MTNDLSLYFHIPFCVRKCAYCAFYSLPGQSDALKEEYAEAVLRQFEFFEDERRATSVYFGGGPPTELGIDALCKLISTAAERFAEEDCEITVEVNPGAVDRKGLAALRGAGANRLSVGVQSSNDEILKKLGRIHRFKDTVDCFENARAAGFSDISADVMFALPYGEPERFGEELLRIIELEPTHISAYSLQLEEGTKLYALKDRLEFPGEDAEENEYDTLCGIAEKNGFKHYEISSYAKPGFESRHNSGYWSMREYFGFGAGAHSFYGGKRFSAPNDVKRFIERSKLSLYAPTDFDKVLPLSKKDLFEEKIMLGLRTCKGAEIPDNKRGVAQMIASQGFGTFENGVLRLNSKGFRVSNKIISDVLY